MILAELAMEAGLPDGVLNIVHGAHVSILFFMKLFVLCYVHNYVVLKLYTHYRLSFFVYNVYLCLRLGSQYSE